MKGLNRRLHGPNYSNKIRRGTSGQFYECRHCGANYQYKRDARNCSHNKKQNCEECEKMKYTMCISCKDEGYTICRECCEFGPMPCEIWDSVESDKEMDAESFEAPRAKVIGGIRISKNPYFPTGTSLQGYVKTNRQELRSAFGNPNMRESDDGKSKGKEWNLYLGGKRVTIYDYREKGKRGTKYFNIGGKEKYAPLLVAQVLSAHTGEYRPAKDIHPQWLEDERRHELVESLDDYPNIDFVKAQEVENNRAYYRMKHNKKNFPNYGAESYGFCAVCNHIGMFQVEDLPVGPRWFCTEKHYAQYAGLPVKESGYYGFEAEREIETEYFARFGDKRGGKEWGTYNFEWWSDAGDWKPLGEDTTGWDEDDFEDFRLEKEYELIHDMLQNPKSGLYRAIENIQTEGWDEEFQTSYQVRDEDGDVRKLDLYITWSEPHNVRQKIQYYDKEPLYRLEFFADSKKLPPVEKAIDSGIASGATMEGLDLALGAEEPPEKDDPLESWMEDFDTEEPSVYWWTKGVIMEKMKDRDLTEDDLVNIIELVAVNAPMDSITRGMREAEQLGDKHIWEILKLAATGRAELLTDDMIHSEKLREYQTEDEVEMMSCPHCSEFGDGEIPSSVDYDPGDRWEPPSIDVNTWETCEYCDGKGEVEDTPENEKIPTWDWDSLTPPEPDYDRYEGRYDDWEAEGGDADATVVWEMMQQNFNNPDAVRLYYTTIFGDDPHHLDQSHAGMVEMVAEAVQQNWRNQDFINYVSKELGFDIQEAESNGDKQLEESIKRTKMSAIRTGLAITTFGIVLWNLWTNKKQESQISDIMDLV